MKDNVQIAGHLQDTVRGLNDVERKVGEVVEAVRSAPQPKVDLPGTVFVVNVPGPSGHEKAADQAPPIVNVTVPVPIVNVAPAAVTIERPAPVAYRVTVTDRDDQGFIRSFVVAPI